MTMFSVQMKTICCEILFHMLCSVLICCVRILHMLCNYKVRPYVV